jgi:hypothetical protein
LAKEQYVKQQSRMCAQLRFNICTEIVVKLDSELWYEYVPKSVESSQEGKVTTLWTQQVQTDRTIPNNKTEIINRNNEQGTHILHKHTNTSTSLLKLLVQVHL